MARTFWRRVISTALVEPFAKGHELHGVGYRDILHRDLDVAAVGVAGDPVGVAQSFEGQGDGFVERAGGDVHRMLGAFEVAEGHFAGFEFHGGSVTSSLFVRQAKNRKKKQERQAGSRSTATATAGVNGV